MQNHRTKIIIVCTMIGLLFLFSIRDSLGFYLISIGAILVFVVFPVALIVWFGSILVQRFWVAQRQVYRYLHRPSKLSQTTFKNYLSLVHRHHLLNAFKLRFTAISHLNLTGYLLGCLLGRLLITLARQHRF